MVTRFSENLAGCRGKDGKEERQRILKQRGGRDYFHGGKTRETKLALKGGVKKSKN